MITYRTTRRLFKQNSKLHACASAALLMTLVCSPLFCNDFFLVQVGVQTIALGLVALSLTVLAGWGGMVSLSQMTVAGIAGYIIAFASGTLPFWIAIPMAISGSAMFAVIVGFASIRTSGTQTIMITLAVGVATFFFCNQNYSIFGGFTGYSGIAAPTVGNVDVRSPIVFYYVALATGVTAFAFIEYLSLTPFGLALKATRDNARRMSAIGFDIRAHRLAAHAVAGTIAGVGGILLVWLNGRISPGVIGVGPLINILIIAVIGGIGRPWGAFLGAMIFVLAKTFAIDVVGADRFNTLIGMTFLAIVLLSPDGLTGLFDRLGNQSRPSDNDSGSKH